MATLQSVPIDAIDHNPFRDVKTYPFTPRKIDTLKRSIEDVGLWEGGIMGRRVGNRFQLAFGHHRFEAARQSGLKSIMIVVRELTDAQMLRFMGRENIEDYNSDFLAMLQTWEATWVWCATNRVGDGDQALEVAKLLGWTMPRSDNSSKVQMNRTAGACNAARKLILNKHITRADLTDLNVTQAREICERAQTNIERIEKAGKALQTPAAHIAAAKEAVAKAVKTTAKESLAGEVSQKDLRSQVDINAYRHAQASKVKGTPMFAAFGKMIADGIGKMLKTDVAAEKLNEVIKMIPHITSPEDHAVVRRLEFELNELSDRATKLSKRVVLDKVVSFTTIKGGVDEVSS